MGGTPPADSTRLAQHAPATRGMSHSIRLRDIPGGLYELARLALITRMRFRGPYWTWRLHTAFGRGYPASRAELYASVIEYGIWIRRIRRA